MGSVLIICLVFSVLFLLIPVLCFVPNAVCVVRPRCGVLVHFVLLFFCRFLVPCYGVRYDFRIKTMFGRSYPQLFVGGFVSYLSYHMSYPQLFVGGFVSYLRYLCMFVLSGVHYVLTM